jgi:hypothetical protein
MSIKLKQDDEKDAKEMRDGYLKLLQDDPTERVEYFKRAKQLLTNNLFRLLGASEEDKTFQIQLFSNHLVGVLKDFSDIKNNHIRAFVDPLTGKEITPVERCKNIAGDEAKIKYLVSVSNELISILDGLINPPLTIVVLNRIKLILLAEEWEGPVGKTSAFLITLGVILSAFQIQCPSFSEYSHEYWYVHPLGWGIYSLLIAFIGLLSNQSKSLSNTIKWVITFIGAIITLAIIMPRVASTFW